MLSDMATLVMGSVFSLGSAGIYAYVGSQIAGRTVSSAARLASAMFAIWWYGLAGVSFISGVLNLCAAAGLRDLNLWLTFGMFNLLLLCAALGGLLYYLVFLYTGSRRALAPLAAFYALLYVALMYLVNLATPTHIEIGRWRAEVKYVEEFNQAYAILFVILLLVPQMLAALAYFSLFFQTTDLTQRYRIALVSGAIVLWFGVSLAVGFVGGREFSESDIWQVLSRVLSLLAPFMILVAYKPPKAWKRRFGLRSVEERPMEVPDGRAAS